MVEHSHSLDDVFSALCDPTRRAMLAELRSGQRTIAELAAPHAMSLAGASKHVKVLQAAGLVACIRKGRSRVCTLQPAPLAEAERWLSTYAEFWTRRLDALEAVLEKEANNDDT